MTRRDLILPLIAACFVTGVNALKPAVVDDAAYLRMAEHLTSRPLDPYGFEQFWYARPQPAIEVLAPPVVPYLLALGLTCGDDLRLVKLALFPVIWLFTWAVSDLLRRFAPGRERLGLLLMATSPAILPMVNAMLDIPAAALGLGSLALFARGCDPGRRAWVHALGSGLLAGLAFQTKYTALTVPVVLVWYALPHRRFGSAGIALVTACILAGGWELFLVNQYGQSHFLYHAADQASTGTLAERFDQKWSFARPLLNYLGLLGCGWGLVAGRAAGLPQWAVRAAMTGFAVGLFVVIVGPLDWLAPARPPLAYPRLGFALNLFGLSGLLTLVTLGGGLVACLNHPPAGSRLTWFLAGWLAIEMVAALALTPFPAGRRVIMVSVVLGFVALRVVTLRSESTSSLAPGRVVVGYCVGLGLLLSALDHWDARPEMTLAERSARVIPPGATVWTQGAWGWQYYTRREGFRMMVAGESHLEPGDWVVLPAHPSADGFFRPGDPTSRIDPAAVEFVAALVADDPLPYTTLPTLYGGPSPILGRDYPRLTVEVYRVVRPTRPSSPWPH